MFAREAFWRGKRDEELVPVPCGVDSLSFAG